ncbi:ATP-binding protein [Pendulispora brunnea]|uniref:histidine kinase n=1 Tax=Pendulispora brunnea TaxID=2905690 RepID=A0ABZ2KDQ8_9BACT
MRLVPKLATAMVGAMCLVLAANGYLRVRREVAVLQADRIGDHALLGRSLSAAVSAAWRSEGRTAALRAVDRLNAQGGRVHARWVDASATVDDEAARKALETDTIPTRIERTPAGDKRSSDTPVVVGTERVGVVELSESLDAEERASHRIVIDTLLTTLTMVLVCSVIAIVLGLWLVGRPIRALSAKARRIGAGDFSQPLALKQKDELGFLAGEMNAMCDRLEEATRRAEKETAARIRTIEQLRHADRLMTVGMLSSGIAHELGTPLNIVLARAQLLESEDVTPPERVDYARVIVDAANKMAKIIRQLLTFARRKPAQKAPRDLRRIARDTIELLQPLADKSHAHIELVEGPPELIAEIDGDGIQQAVTNLLVNAIQSMPRGGTIDVLVDRARNSTASEGVIVSVRDQGQGIAEEHLPRIFEPFFTTKEVGSGTGLGLSVAHGIVEDHGGFIEVTSTPCKGSTFTIHLPGEIPT